MRLVVPARLLEEARAVFEAAGAHGAEATAMLGGLVVDGEQHATRVVVPDQHAGTRGGCWVEVTERGKRELAAALALEERYLARIHSHPGEAFHSRTDDANLGLTAEGAWSIVVPYFGLGLRRGMHACAVYQRTGGRWERLSARHVAERLLVVDDA
jgi:hypothetical protein